MDELVDEILATNYLVKTISARLIWAIVERALLRSQLDLYLDLVGGLCGEVRTTFSQALIDDLEKRVLPKIHFILNQAVSTKRPSLVIRAILLIVRLVPILMPLKNDLEETLIERLYQFGSAIQQEDYTSLQGYHQLSQRLNSLRWPLPLPPKSIWKVLNQLKEQIWLTFSQQ